jgi:NitT/TauT family transport system ATP-binding protein
MALIRIQNVKVAYSGRTVLDDVSLDIHQGEFVCLLGQTGCGKTTMLRLVLGSERPRSGQILIDGVEHNQPDRTRGYVPQKYSLFPDKTVLDNITFGPEVTEFNLLRRFTPAFHRRRKQLRVEARDYLRRIGLRESDAAKYPDQLSGGMQQRVAIAQALINRPRILLMDEAFSALDPNTRRDMQHLIKELWREMGATILFVTHNTSEAIRLASRVIVLAKPSPDCGSRVALDIPIPQPCSEDEAPALAHKLECLDLGDVTASSPAEALSARS